VGALAAAEPAGLQDAHHRGCDRHLVVVRKNAHVGSVRARDAGVGGAEVDSEGDVAHAALLRMTTCPCFTTVPFHMTIGETVSSIVPLSGAAGSSSVSTISTASPAS